MHVVVLDPRSEGTDSGERPGPLMPPEVLLFQRAPHPLGVGIALRIVIAREGLMNAQRVARPPACHRGGLTAVVAHQAQAVAPDPLRNLVVHGQVQGGQPGLRGGAQGRMVSHDRLGLPIEHHDAIDPAHVLDQDLGHVNAPPLVRPGGVGLAPRRRPLGFQALPGCHEQVMLPHQAQDPFLVDRQLLDKAQGRPAPAVSPAGVLRLQGLETFEPPFVARHDPQRGLPTPPSPASLFLTPG